MSQHQAEDTLEESKTAHPIELFFDLVYVFAFTRVVGLIVHDHNLTSALEGALLLGLLWWSWGTWTWTMNAVDLTDRVRRVVILLSMLAVFLMGFAVPTAFSGDAMWLAVGYVVSRVLAASVMWFGTLNDKVEHEAIRNYLPVSLIAPVLMVVGAAIGGDSVAWIWFVAVLIEVGAALLSGRSEWHIDAEHFAERHGLIMIIAMGEAIIAVGVALTAAAGEDFNITMALAWRLAVGLAGVCTMWWAYFDKLQVIWERRLFDADAMSTGPLARDVYSLGHYPMITGIVFYAVALEEAFLHPTDPLNAFTRWMLATAVALYFLSQALAMYRCYQAVMYERIVGVVVVVGFIAITTVNAELAVLIAAAVMIIAIAAEYWRFRDEVRNNVHLRR